MFKSQTTLCKSLKSIGMRISRHQEHFEWKDAYLKDNGLVLPHYVPLGPRLGDGRRVLGWFHSLTTSFSVFLFVTMLQLPGIYLPLPWSSQIVASSLVNSRVSLIPIGRYLYGLTNMYMYF